MDARTGQVYPSLTLAQEAIEKEGKSEKDTNARMKDLVEISGTEKSIKSISDAVKADRRRKNKAARKSKKKNRTKR